MRTETFIGKYYDSHLEVTKNAPWGTSDAKTLKLVVNDQDGSEATIYMDAEAELRLLKFLLER